MEDIHREDSSLQNDWALKETPRERGSCLQLSVDGQCVNKAVALLSALKEHLTIWRHHSHDINEKRRSINISKNKNENLHCPLLSESPSKSPPSCSHPSNAITFCIPPQDALSEDGTQLSSANGTRRVFEWSNVEDIISHTLSLIIRLEDDRSDTVRLWEEERERVRKMRKRLDEKATERLTILPLLVQQEHERCMKDLIELKWHVSFEKRQLEHIRDDVKIIDDDNHQYQEEISKTNDILLLLQEKVKVEGDKMAAIIHQQTVTAEELKKRKKDLSRLQEKAHQTRVRVSNKKKHINKMLDDLKVKVNRTFETLNNSQLEQAALTHKINSARTSITENKKEKSFKKEKLNGLKQQKTDIEKRVIDLKELNAQVDKEIENLKERNLSLRKQKQEQDAILDAEHTALISDTQKWNEKLKNIRQRNEDMICEMNEMKEQTHESERQYQDDVKSVERAKRELQKIDKQLQVVHSQTEVIRQEHLELTQSIKDDELKLGNVEDQLRCTVQGLKEELQKETKIKMSFQEKIQVDEVDFEKMKVEDKRKEDNVNETAKEIEIKKNDHHEAMDKLLITHKEKQDQEGKLREDVRKALQELKQVEKELEEKHSTLTLKKTQLSTETDTKRSKANNLKERIELLKDKIIDINKSRVSIKRMEDDIKTIIERLEATKTDLLEKISFEKEEEESWKKEFEEISEFSKQANERYTSYLLEREEYFSQLERDTITAIKENRKLGEKYETQRDIHADIKTKTLIVMEHRLDLESAVKDMGQLLALQSALSSTMKAYYKHRGAKSRFDLVSFTRNATTSHKNVDTLQKQLDFVLSSIDGFLNKHTSAQTQLMSRCSVRKIGNKDEQKDETMTNKGEEMKIVSQEMSGQSHHHKKLLLTNREMNSERRDILKAELPSITSTERGSPKSVTFSLPLQCSS